MLANPCTGARWRDSPLGIHRGSGPGHKSQLGARWHLGQRGCSRPGRPSLLERAFDPRKAFKKGTGVRGGAAPRQPPSGDTRVWPRGVCWLPGLSRVRQARRRRVPVAWSASPSAVAEHPRARSRGTRSAHPGGHGVGSTIRATGSVRCSGRSAPKQDAGRLGQVGRMSAADSPDPADFDVFPNSEPKPMIRCSPTQRSGATSEDDSDARPQKGRCDCRGGMVEKAAREAGH